MKFFHWFFFLLEEHAKLNICCGKLYNIILIENCLHYFHLHIPISWFFFLKRISSFFLISFTPPAWCLSWLFFTLNLHNLEDEIRKNIIFWDGKHCAGFIFFFALSQETKEHLIDSKMTTRKVRLICLW